MNTADLFEYIRGSLNSLEKLEIIDDYYIQNNVIFVKIGKVVREVAPNFCTKDSKIFHSHVRDTIKMLEGIALCHDGMKSRSIFSRLWKAWIKH